MVSRHRPMPGRSRGGRRGGGAGTLDLTSNFLSESHFLHATIGGLTPKQPLMKESLIRTLKCFLRILEMSGRRGSKVRQKIVLLGLSLMTLLSASVRVNHLVGCRLSSQVSPKGGPGSSLQAYMAFRYAANRLFGRDRAVSDTRPTARLSV